MFRLFKITLEDEKPRLTHLLGGWWLHKGHYLDFCQFVIDTENAKQREFRNPLQRIQNHSHHKGLSNVLIHVLFPNSAGGIAGQRLSEHPDIRKLGFTGSTAIGKQIMKRYWF